MRLHLTAMALGVALAMAPKPAQAWTTTLENQSIATECSHAALAGDASLAALELCSKALQFDDLTHANEARTYVNRSVIYISRGDWNNSRADLDAAQALAPDVAEIYVNRGAVYIHDNRLPEAIAELDRAISLHTSEPEKAYYNRALARERMDDVRGAYFDYRKASELKPGWADAQLALERFTVERRPASP